MGSGVELGRSEGERGDEMSNQVLDGLGLLWLLRISSGFRRAELAWVFASASSGLTDEGVGLDGPMDRCELGRRSGTSLCI